MDYTKIRLRTDRSTNWNLYNPILADGEFGYESDSKRAKIGDGITDWNNLEYCVDVTAMNQLYSYIETLDDKIEQATNAIANTNEATQQAITAKNNAVTATENAISATERTNTAITNAETATANSTAQTERATTATLNCESATTACSTATENAVVATENANEATIATNTAIANANSAILATNTAINNANTATTNAVNATTDCNNAINRSNTATANCETATSNANSATLATNTAINNANTATQNANNATAGCVSATNDCVTATSNANTAKTNCETATSNANTATSNANTATQNANTATANCETATANCEQATADTSTAISNCETAKTNCETATANCISATESIQDELNQKANYDGEYETLTAGLAYNLVSPDGVTDSEPYIFRTTAGEQSVTTGYSTINSIKGNTIVWNQLCNNGNFNGTTNWIKGDVNQIGWETNNNILTITTLVDNPINYLVYQRMSDYATKFVGNHKYIIKCFGYSETTDFYIGFGNSYTSRISTKEYFKNTGWQELFLYFEFYSFSGAGPYFDICISSSMSANDTIQIKNFVVFDVTKMFGSGNEPASVESFKSMFPNDYYDYNLGTLLNVDINGLQTIGFNAYNNGTANVIGNNQYQITGTYTGVSYSDGTSIEIDSNGLFTPTKNDTLTITGGGSDTCIHLTWSGYRNGDYETYNEHNYSFPISEIVDGNGNQLFPEGLKSAGNVRDEITGTKAIKRVGKKVFNGSEGWSCSYPQCTSTFSVGISGMSTAHYNAYRCDGLTNNYYILANNGGDINGDAIPNYQMLRYSGNLLLRNSNYENNLTGWKNYLSTLYNNGTPMVLYYELATPIEIDLTPIWNMSYYMDDFGTERFVSSSTNVPQTAPVNHSTFYMSNLRDEIRNIPTNYQSQDSMDSLLTTIGGILNGTFTKTYNENTKSYQYTFTQNETEE